MFQKVFSGLCKSVGKLSCLSTCLMSVAIGTYFISMPTDNIWYVTGSLSVPEVESDKEPDITEPIIISDEYNSCASCASCFDAVIVIGDLIRDSSGRLTLYPCSDTWSGIYTFNHPILWFRCRYIKHVRAEPVAVAVDPVE